MTDPDPDHALSHLVSLIEAALAEARRIGAPAAAAASALEQGAAHARAAIAQHGGAEEGIRPEDLTTGNDK